MIANKVVTGYVPTFTLRSIHHNDVITRYLRGDFSQLNLDVGGIKLTNGIGLSTVGGYSADSEVYSYSDRENVSHRIVTTNHDAYNVFIHPTEGSLRCTKCLWCRKGLELDDRIGVGIPVKLEVTAQGYAYHVDLPYHCSTSCALATLRRRQLSKIHRDSIYTDSESLLIHLHRIEHPNEPPLKEAPDWILRVENGGPLTDDEFYKNHTTYRRSTNIIYLPVKIEYFTSSS